MRIGLQKTEIGRWVQELLQRRMGPKASSAGLLSLTIGFWQDQRGFWESVRSAAPEIWRSGEIEKKSGRTLSVGGRIRMFLRHLEVAARWDSEAVGADGRPYSQSS